MKKILSNKTIQAVIAGLVFLVSLNIFQNKNWIVGGLLIVGEVAIFLAVVQKPRPVATPTIEVDSDLLRTIIEEVIVEKYGPTLQSVQDVDSTQIRRLVLETLEGERFRLTEEGYLENIPMSILDPVPDWLSDTDDKPKRIRKIAGK